MQKANLITLILIVLLGVGYLVLSASSNAVEISESLAIIESARSAREASQAAQIASQGLSFISGTQALILLAIVTAVLGLLGGVIYLLLDKRKCDLQTAALLASQQHRWRPGPNAHWQRAELPAAAQAPDVNTLLQLVLAQQIMQQIGQRPRPSPPEQTAAYEYLEDDGEGLPTDW